MKNYVKRITSWVLLLAIVVGATSFTNFDNVNAKEAAPLTPQEPTVLNEENAQDTATQTLSSDYQGATFITKDGIQKGFDLEGYRYNTNLDGKTFTIRPTYRSIDSTGHLIYKEGTSCLSITDHGLANHKKVHLWNNKNNKILIRRDLCPHYQDEKGYSMYDDNTSIGLFNAFEVTDEGYNVPHKYLRGHAYFEQFLGHDLVSHIRYPWQLFDFDTMISTHINGKLRCLVRWRNYGSNLPIGLKDEKSSKNGNEVETKDAGAPDLWTLEEM